MESRLVMAGSALWFLMTYTLPWLLPTTPLLRVVRTVGLLDRGVVNVMTGRRRPADLVETFLGPVSPLAVLPAYAKAVSGRLRWRGRVYVATESGWRS
ncbi:hypothetical protein [Serinibacter arcticus]|uniref:hypothetical protein n=1 Tax=Serinibacter arcticus TaxID=1655435 RepID=UPI0018EE4BB8|nr:hypothetical protein [Serinibacter arcticus]